RAAEDRSGRDGADPAGAAAVGRQRRRGGQGARYLAGDVLSAPGAPGRQGSPDDGVASCVEGAVVEGFSHKALGAIAESLRVHIAVLDGRRAALDEDEDADEVADLFNDAHYLRILLADIE